jgi:predicted secreted protein
MSEIVLTETDHGRTVKIPAGGLIRIELAEMGSAGYTWEVARLDERVLDLLSVEAVDSGRPGLVGAPVLKRWLIRATGSGKTVLWLRHARPWEDRSQAAKELRVTIEVCR